VEQNYLITYCNHTSETSSDRRRRVRR